MRFPLKYSPKDANISLAIAGFVVAALGGVAISFGLTFVREGTNDLLRGIGITVREGGKSS